MKIERLELRAFGPFSGQVLDFSGGRAGLHLIYGPNEAGKSAALRALTDLLFGIPVRSRDNFIHDHKDLRLAARLSAADGAELFFIRRKGRDNTLLDASEHPIEDTVLNGYLRGLTREVFTSMFGIDHEELRRGGKELVEGRGRVAESLYAAALGVSGFRETLKSLDAEAEAIFRPSGRVLPLNKLIGDYRELKKRGAELLLPPGEWTALRKRLGTLEKELGDTVERLKAAGMEAARLERLLNAIPEVGRRKSLLDELESLADVVLLPPEFRERRIRARSDLDAATAAVRQAGLDIEQIERDMGPLRVDPVLVAAEKRINALQLKLGSHEKAMKDEPGLVARRRLLLDDAANILKELAPGRAMEEVEAFRVPVARRTRIQELGLEYQRITTERKNADGELVKLAADLDGAKKALARLDAPRDTTALSRAIRQARKLGDMEGRLASARLQAAETRKQVTARLKSLTLWTGDAETLETLPVPLVETVERFEDALRKGERDLETARGRLAELGEREAGVLRQILAFEREGTVPTEEDLLRAREHRENGWRLVRGAWIEGAADPDAVAAYAAGKELPAAYEESVRKADEAGDRLRREADRAARLAGLTAERDDVVSRKAKATAEVERLGVSLDSTRDDWTALWRDAGIVPLSPKEMRTWLGRHEKLVQLLGQVRREETEAARLAEILDAETANLASALAEVGEPGPGPGETFTALLDRAEEVKTRHDGNARQREKLDERMDSATRRMESAREMLATSETALDAWRESWRKAVEALGLGADATPLEVNAVLARSQELIARVDEAAGLAARIDGIRRDADSFEAETRELVRSVAPDMDAPDIPASRLAADLRGRLSRALKEAERERELRKQHREKSELLRKAEAAMRDAEDRLGALKTLARCETEDELHLAENRSERLRDARRAVSENAKRLAAWSAGGSIEDLVAEAGASDPDLLPVMLAEARKNIEDLDAERSRLDREIGGVREKLGGMDGGSGAAEAAQAAEATLAEIRERAEQYARLKLASVVLAREIERYRERNQGPILERASAIFAALTLGSFSGLKPSFDVGDQPVLEGVRPSGVSVGVADMSDGSRDQLYLSLRLASLEWHLKSGEAVPFVLDDILINFDDMRSEATLRVLSDLAARTQVLFFTHHEHLIDLARASAASDVLNIHRLRD